MDPLDFYITQDRFSDPGVYAEQYALLPASLDGLHQSINHTNVFWMDHWVCEYWDARAKRWVIEDPNAQMHSVPGSRFYTGLRAWEMYRKRPDIGIMFGYGKDDRGAHAARSNAVHDFAALNGFVCVSGDYWGLGGKREEDLDKADLDILDEIVRIGDSNDAYAQRCALFETCQGLKPEETIWHFDYLETNQANVMRWQE